MAFGTDAGNLFQVCVILKDHLRTTLVEGAESGPKVTKASMSLAHYRRAVTSLSCVELGATFGAKC